VLRKTRKTELRSAEKTGLSGIKKEALKSPGNLDSEGVVAVGGDKKSHRDSVKGETRNKDKEMSGCFVSSTEKMVSKYEAEKKGKTTLNIKDISSKNSTAAGILEASIESPHAVTPVCKDFVVAAQPRSEKAASLPSFPFVDRLVDAEDVDDEDDEVDSERLFSLTKILDSSPYKGRKDGNAPAMIEVARIHRGEIKDLQHIALGSSYSACVGGKELKIARNGRDNRCQIFYSQRHFRGSVGDYDSKNSGGADAKSLPSSNSKKQIRYTLPTNKVVFLKAGNDEYRMRIVPTSISCNIPDESPPSGKRFKHFLQYSALFHVFVIIIVSLVYSLTNKEIELKEEPRFTQVSLQDFNKVSPTPKPKAKPPADLKNVKQDKVEKPKPAKGKNVKVTKKPESHSPKPKNAGGGSKNGGNIKKRDVKSSGLLAALGTKKGRQPGKIQALATISSIDAVSTLDSESAVLKVGGLAAKVKGARIEVATGGLINTSGSTKVLRSGGAEGDGSIAALETGVTGSRDVRGKVSATLTRKVNISGGLSRNEVKRVIDAHMDEVVYCYEKTLLSTPGLAGKVVFEWKVLLSGRVGAVNIKSSSLRANEIHSCIKSAIKSWQFPQPTGTSVFVSFPFIFDSVEF